MMVWGDISDNTIEVYKIQTLKFLLKGIEGCSKQ